LLSVIHGPFLLRAPLVLGRIDGKGCEYDHHFVLKTDLLHHVQATGQLGRDRTERGLYALARLAYEHGHLGRVLPLVTTFANRQEDKLLSREEVLVIYVVRVGFVSVQLHSWR
jgi:hypothetical protein